MIVIKKMVNLSTCSIIRLYNLLSFQAALGLRKRKIDPSLKNLNDLSNHLYSMNKDSDKLSRKTGQQHMTVMKDESVER